MKKKWIYIGAAAAIVILAVSAVWITFHQLSKPENTLDKLDEAVQEEDPELLSEIIVPDDQDAEVSTVTIQALINYLKKNNNSFQVIKDAMYDQIEKDDYSVTSQQVSLIQEGKKWGLFPDYKLYVRTSTLKVSGQNDGDDVELSIKGLDQPLQKDEDGVYGPLLPGNYELLVSVKNDLTTITEEKQVDAWRNNQVSVIVDTNKLMEQDENIQKEIMQALDIFNNDLSKFTTSEFDLAAFSNVSGTYDEDQVLFTSEFEVMREFIDEIQSQYKGAIVNLDTLDIGYFNGEWTAEITAFVSYDEKVKVSGIDEFEDFSFDAIRDYSLVYDSEEATWLIYDVMDSEADGSEPDEWENTEDMMLDDPPVLKWNKEGSGTSI